MSEFIKTVLRNQVFGKIAASYLRWFGHLERMKEDSKAIGTFEYNSFFRALNVFHEIPILVISGFRRKV